jgi:fused signal recognition particle receptor
MLCESLPGEGRTGAAMGAKPTAARPSTSVAIGCTAPAPGRRRDVRQSSAVSTPLEPKGFFARLKARLSRGGVSIARDLRAVLVGRKIDAAVLEDLETRLLTADVGVEATSEILAELNRRVARHELNDVEALLNALREQLTDILTPSEAPLQIARSPIRPFVVLIVGVNGSGKTTSIGKLARRLREQQLSVMLAAGDTFRAAAVEQLHVWAERTGALFSSQQAGADPGAVIFDALQSARARGIDVLLADTAGRLHSQAHLMEELKKVKRVIARILPEAPHEVLLVLDANQGQNALAQAQQFHAALGVTGLVLTKLDGTARGGIVVAISRKLRLPIRFIGVGEGAEDFGEFNARAFASALIDGAAGERSDGGDERDTDQARATSAT